ncbi:MAG TPA: lasso RiPP family leader peptide-containing protein [Acidobacteriota bacterium]|jgi:hypothetical protein|nr:lasso RiPP family leader peptide-containing protein [Acidobacteriota bacterium]
MKEDRAKFAEETEEKHTQEIHKKFYIVPKLIIHGTVRDVTQSGQGALADITTLGST